jgi:poly(hydroxyalkanoate) depolymerase family esterase
MPRLLLSLAIVFCAARPAFAASLQEVVGFGNNPSNEKMFIYVPDRVAASPPLLVAIHYCGGSASAFFTGTGYRSVADQYGFIVVYPQTTSSDGCFDVHSDATLKHDGGGDSAGIASMVHYTISKYGANASRVYVTGTSSGAMMTNVLLGAYPELFRGGAVFAGVPYGCFAGQSAWNSACANGQITKSAQQWGDLARSAYPGYAGPRPRVQLWHGDQDQTLNFHNLGEEIKQWTNVLGVSETPTTMEANTPQSGWTRTRYTDASGVVRVEAVLEAGMTHNLSVPANEVVRFFGLDAAMDPGGTPGSGGAGAGGGGTGASGMGSAAGRGAAGTSAMGSGPGSPGGSGISGVPGAAGIGAVAGTGAAGTGSRLGSSGNAAPTIGGAGGSSVTLGSVPGSSQAGGTAVVDAAGNGSEPHAGHASGACSVREGNPRRGGSTALLILVLVAALLRSRRARRRNTRALGAANFEWRQ